MIKTFYKMQGTGNDYILFDGIDQEMKTDFSRLSKRLSDRHFGIGGDGVILLCPSKKADCQMLMFNADGSEGKMCGNGIRLVAKLFYDLGYTHKREITVQTASGIRSLALFPDEGDKIKTVKVDMGQPIFETWRIPVLLDEKTVIGKEIFLFGERYNITCVSMGNPHCVVFSNSKNIDVSQLGSRLEKNELFPEGVNTEIVCVESEREITLRVWERGSGETLSCGTGACASVAAAVKNNYCKKNTDITVKVKGGTLSVFLSDSNVYLTGGAELVYEGCVRI